MYAYEPFDHAKKRLAEKCRSGETLTETDRDDIAQLLDIAVLPEVKVGKGRPSACGRNKAFALDYIAARKSGVVHKDCVGRLALKHGIKSARGANPEPAYSNALSKGLKYLLDEKRYKCMEITSLFIDNKDNDDFEYGKSLFAEVKQIISQQEERKKANYNKKSLK